MPANEIHRLIDLIAFGNDYWWLHKVKDIPLGIWGNSTEKCATMAMPNGFANLKTWGIGQETEKFVNRMKFMTL